MKGNLDAKKKLGILMRKNAESFGDPEEFKLLHDLAETLRMLDAICDDLDNKEFDPSFQSEIKSIIKQALEERLV